MKRATGIGGMLRAERDAVVMSRSKVQRHFDERSRRNNGKPPFSAKMRSPGE